MCNTVKSAALLFANVSALSIEKILARLPNASIKEYLDSLNKKFEPTTITVTCTPSGEAPDDYQLHIDLEEFKAALSESKLVMPVLEVKAISDDLDRELLTNRLCDVFSREISKLELKREELLEQAQEKRKGGEKGLMNSVSDLISSGIELTILTAALGAGSLIGPIWILLLAVCGFEVIFDLPNLASKLFKWALGRTSLSDRESTLANELEEELKKCEPMIKALIQKNIQIKVVTM